MSGRRRLAAGLSLLAVVTGACSSSHARRSSSAAPPVTQITAKPVGTGSSGVGPLVVPAPPSGSGEPTVQHVQLAGRELIVESVSRSDANGAVTVRLDVAVHNTGSTPVQNDVSYFTLISQQGDTFADPAAPAGFNGPVAAGAQRRATLLYQVPAAAVAGMRLLYRPDVASDAALVPLPIA